MSGRNRMEDAGGSQGSLKMLVMFFHGSVDEKHEGRQIYSRVEPIMFAGFHVDDGCLGARKPSKTTVPFSAN